MSYYILADCNNFYVSCERLLNPKLENKPVIVLSNNDGCVIARSEEAKALGIKMGEPYFKIEAFCKRMKVFVRSSNYSLYGDISRRVMTVLADRVPELEVYSIDEAFLKYPKNLTLNELELIAHELRAKIKRWIGIPISLGIGPTKTLAKVANNLAKKNKTVVFNLCSENIRNAIFENHPIGDIWGIGSGFKQRLALLGIHTVSDFITAKPLVIKREMGVVGERMLLELKGISCLDLSIVANKKSITCSRSFGQFLDKESDIAEALSTFAANGCVKLRKQKSFAKAIYVFLETAELHFKEYKRFKFDATTDFLTPTQDTAEVITAAKKCLKRIFQPNIRYKKCGIIFMDLVSEDEIIPDLFIQPASPKQKELMQTIDQLNKKLGKNKVYFAAMGITIGTGPVWKMRSAYKSPHNTTSWKFLPLVKA